MCKPIFILVRPQLGENVGMAARAMLNCGLESLRVVAPRDGWPLEKAHRASAGADHVLSSATVYPDVRQAIADLNLVYATSARRRDMNTPWIGLSEATRSLHTHLGAGERCGVLFGCEKAGLSNEDVAHSHAVVTLPLNPSFTSLNLSQAVLLVAHNWFCWEAAPHKFGTIAPLAPQEEVTLFVDRLLGALGQGGFFRTSALRPTVERNIWSVCKKAHLTSQEVRSLHGMLTCLGRAPHRKQQPQDQRKTRERV